MTISFSPNAYNSTISNTNAVKVAEVSDQKETASNSQSKPNENNNDRVSISKKGLQLSKSSPSSDLNIKNTGRESVNEKLQSIASRYDVTNISTNERGAMAQELSDNGLLPEGMMIHMVAPLSMNENRDLKSNYLNITKESFLFAAKMGGNSEQLEMRSKMIELLGQLKTLA